MGNGTPGHGIHETCPFCGGCDLAVVENRQSIVDHLEYWVRCRQCSSVGPVKVRRHHAIEAWNLRITAKSMASIATEFE